MRQCIHSDDVRRELSDRHTLLELFAGGYTSALLLQAADRVGLESSGILPAKISLLLKALSGTSIMELYTGSSNPLIG